MKTNDNNTNDRTETKHMYVVYFVGFEDANDSEESRVEPKVASERIETGGDAEQNATDAEWAALLRGGRVMALLEDDANLAEHARAALEAQIMRYR